MTFHLPHHDPRPLLLDSAGRLEQPSRSKTILTWLATIAVGVFLTICVFGGDQ